MRGLLTRLRTMRGRPREEDQFTVYAIDAYFFS